MFGASFLKLVKFFIKGNALTGPQIFYTILGMLVAFGVSVYSIQFLMGYVRRSMILNSLVINRYYFRYCGAGILRDHSTGIIIIVPPKCRSAG